VPVVGETLSAEAARLLVVGEMLLAAAERLLVEAGTLLVAVGTLSVVVGMLSAALAGKLEVAQRKLGVRALVPRVGDF
jgi:hypothetical protein